MSQRDSVSRVSATHFHASLLSAFGGDGEVKILDFISLSHILKPAWVGSDAFYVIQKL